MDEGTFVNLSFRRLMDDATRLTRAGDLRGATAAIRAALAGAAAPGPGDAAAVVDVDARVVDTAARRVGVQARGVDEAGGVDGEARVVDGGAAPLARAPHPEGRFVAGSHTDAAGTREYKLYVPPGSRGQPLPLVVMLHGCTQDPDDFAAGTRMNDAALERGFFVLYPAQAQHVNASRCWNWFKHSHQRRGRGEPALLAGMVRDVAKRHAVDPRRVYVAGLSAGGAMAAILGDAYPDVFAAVGVHSGLAAGSAGDAKAAFEAMKGGAGVPPAGPGVPTIVFHGDRDTTVHPVNGDRVVAASVAGATPEVEHGRSDDGRAYTRRTYRDATGRVVAEHWIVHGAGHAWSGGSPRGSYTDARGPTATDAMLRFFSRHSLHARAG